MKTLTFETGALGLHKPIEMMLRSAFAKGKPNIMFYRCYNFKNEKLEKELKNNYF